MWSLSLEGEYSKLILYSTRIITRRTPPPLQHTRYFVVSRLHNRSNSSSISVLIGAVAFLFNASCIAANIPDLLTILLTLTLQFPAFGLTGICCIIWPCCGFCCPCACACCCLMACSCNARAFSCATYCSMLRPCFAAFLETRVFLLLIRSMALA
jgi:hypothetical protein